MDLTNGFLDFADGKLYCDWFYDLDKPSFDDLINADLSLHKNTERNENNIYIKLSQMKKSKECFQ